MTELPGLTIVQRWLLRHAQRHPRDDLRANYTRLLQGISGRVVEIGCGPGQLFGHYPSSVTSLVAVEINPVMRASAEKAGRTVSVPVRVMDGAPDGGLPLRDASVDVVVCCELLCSAADPQRLLAEGRRVLRPGGELRVYEHDLAARRAGRWAQRAVDALGWPRMMGGCHAARNVSGMIVDGGFVWVDLQRLWSARLPLTWPIGPHILGVAIRA